MYCIYFSTKLLVLQVTTSPEINLVWFTRPSSSSSSAQHGARSTPSFWRGRFDVACDDADDSHRPRDSFLRASADWGRGAAFLNGLCLGRHWAALGPQRTLYAPAPALRCGAGNELVLFETDSVPEGCLDADGEGCTVEFLDEPDLDGPTPKAS